MSQASDKRDYSWVAGYEKTWESIKEDQSGSLVASLEKMVRDTHTDLRAKRQHTNATATTIGGTPRLGMVRHLYLVIDLSTAMLERDLHPNRLICTLRCLKKFVENFFDQNPLSQLGIISTSSSKAQLVSALSGGFIQHLRALEELAKQQQCVGEPSIQNALVMAESRLRHMPSYSSREVLLILASMTTCDPGDIHQTIQSLITHRIRCSVISLAVEVFVHRALAEATEGSLAVIMDAPHLKTVLQGFVHPPPVSEDKDAALLRIGFPHSTAADFEQFPVRVCMCHLPSVENKGEATGGANSESSVAVGSSNRPRGSYLCPRCHSAYCELPVECAVCGITLMSAPHLARAYHHLFPLPRFVEVPRSEAPSTAPRGDPLGCGGCNVNLQLKSVVYKCPKCNHYFCADCDAFLHDFVHSCPKCPVA
ncbi:General transcription factor IIH subunit 2 [Taenia crassiceps]|uniref:General transcription factor IIH subunit n=1 Tax=Taenia crassiceps TaxID=6207 RepID=A0ABR4QCX6_9CEST